MTHYNNNQYYNRYLLSFLISSYLSIKLIRYTNPFDLPIIIRNNEYNYNFGISNLDWEILSGYLILDSMYPNNKSTLIHHIINLIALHFGNNIYFNHISLFQEISTPFLCSRYLFPKKYQQIFNYLFVLTFFYFRIFIFNYLVYTNFFYVYNNDKVLFICGLLQFLINNYWFTIILKKLI